MDSLLEKNFDGLNLERSNWQLVRFGDIAIQQKETVDRESTELTRYVKGEHMYSEDPHLREWGELKNEYLGPAFIRKFEEGDILYGSRRTYLRKVTIAPFSGITSNTTFVMKADEQKIRKELLPYVMLSEGFSEHSTKNSKGSVNPYVNWKDLAKYEFLLPPIETQEKLVQLFDSLDVASESKLSVLNKLKYCLNSFLEHKVTRLTEFGFPKVSLKELIGIKHGYPFKSEYWANDDGELPIAVAIGNYEYEGGFRFDSTKVKCYSGDYPSDYNLNAGDLLLAMTCQTPGGEILGIPGVIADDGRTYLHNQRIGKVEVYEKERVLLTYLYLLFLTDDFRRFIFSSASGTKVLHTSPTKILDYQFNLPPLEYQENIVGEYWKIFNAKELVLKEMNEKKIVGKSLINQVF